MKGFDKSDFCPQSAPLTNEHW